MKYSYSVPLLNFREKSDIVCVNRGVSSINGGAINSPSTSCITDPIRKIFFSPPMEPLDHNGNNTITWSNVKFQDIDNDTITFNIDVTVPIYNITTISFLWCET